MLKTRTKVCSTFIGCVPLLGGLCSSPTSWEVASVIDLVVARHMARLMVNCFRFANQVAKFMCSIVQRYFVDKSHGKPQMSRRWLTSGTQVEHNWNTSGTQLEHKWKTGTQAEHNWNTIGTQLEHEWNTSGTQLEHNWNTTGKLEHKWNTTGTQVQHNWNTSGTQLENWNTTQLEHNWKTGTQLSPSTPSPRSPAPIPKWSPGTPKAPSTPKR